MPRAKSRKTSEIPTRWYRSPVDCPNRVVSRSWSSSCSPFPSPGLSPTQKAASGTVKVSLSEKRGQPTSNAIARNTAYARAASQGTFDSELLLYPRFEFTRGGEQKIVDDPDRLSVKFNAKNAQWSSVAPRGAVTKWASTRPSQLRERQSLQILRNSPGQTPGQTPWSAAGPAA